MPCDLEKHKGIFLWRFTVQFLLSLGTRRKKNSKVKNKNTSFSQCIWSDIAMTGKCELCEGGRVQHTDRLSSKRELQSSRRLKGAPPVYPGEAWWVRMSLKPVYTLASEMKNYTKRNAWFLLTILKRSLSLILGKVFCLSVFPLWQMWCRGVGSKGFCPGQMVEHKASAKSRNNLKEGRDFLESIRWSQNKWLLLFS